MSQLLSQINSLKTAINSNPGRGVIYATGGGLTAFGMLTEDGGGSNTLLAGRIPYAMEDFLDIIPTPPDRFVSSEAARQLSVAAFNHARRIRGETPIDQIFGIGATSKLTRGKNDRPNRTNEVFVSLQTHNKTIVHQSHLSGVDRRHQESINAALILNLLAEAKGVEPIELDRPVNRQEASAPSQVSDILAGSYPFLVLMLGDVYHSKKAPSLIFPGSWRPLHDGHRNIARIAEERSGKACHFELTLTNPDKPSVDWIDLDERIRQFDHRPILITNAPTFVEKARIFPGSTFVVGHDTAIRLINPRYYGQGTESERDSMLDELEYLQITFMIFGRSDNVGQFQTGIPETSSQRVREFFQRRVQFVPEEEFRLDISSSKLRQMG